MLAADKLLLTSTIRKNATELKGKELALHKAGTPSFGNRTSGTNICREWQVTDILLQSDCCVWMIGILNLLCRHPLVLPCPGTRNQNAGWLLSNGVTNYLRIDMVNCHRSILRHYSLYLPNQDFTECHWRVLVPLSTTKLRNNKLRVRLVPAWKKLKQRGFCSPFHRWNRLIVYFFFVLSWKPPLQGNFDAVGTQAAVLAGFAVAWEQLVVVIWTVAGTFNHGSVLGSWICSSKMMKHLVFGDQKSEALILPASMTSWYLRWHLWLFWLFEGDLYIACKTYVTQVVMVVEFHMPETAHFALQGVYYIFAVITSPGGIRLA